MNSNTDNVISLEEKMNMYYKKKDRKKQKKTLSSKSILYLLLIALLIIVWTGFFISNNLKSTSSVIVSTPHKIVLKVNKYNKVTKVEGYSPTSMKIAKDNKYFLENINDSLISLLDYCLEKEFINEKSKILILINSKENTTVDLDKFKEYATEEKIKYTINDNGK